MNKHLFPVRALWAACASVCLAAVWLPMSVSAQPPASAASRPAAIRWADFIVAVVNSEPITNQEVQTLVLRLQREAQAQGRPVDAPEAKKLALEQLINDKAQIQQARDAGIVVDEDALDQAEAGVASNNQLTREALRQRLQQDGVSLTTFREQLRNQLLLTRVREREVEARIRISDIEVEKFLQEQIKAQAARAPAEMNLAMILIVLPMMLITGLSMSPGFNAIGGLLLDLMGGRQSARTLHFISAALIVGFIAIHVVLVIWTGLFNNMRAMITGWFVIEPPGSTAGPKRRRKPPTEPGDPS